MNLFFPLFAAAFTMPDISPYLTKARETADGVSLLIGDNYVWGLLGGGPLVVLCGLAMVRMMFQRAKYYALEYGRTGFFGRLSAIGPFVVMGAALLVAGLAGTWLGWEGQGYSVTLKPEGVVEESRGASHHYSWQEMNAESSSTHIKSTDFTLVFTQNGRRCAARFQQRFIGEKLQDKAISIAEQALASRR